MRIGRGAALAPAAHIIWNGPPRAGFRALRQAVREASRNGNAHHAGGMMGVCDDLQFSAGGGSGCLLLIFVGVLHRARILALGGDVAVDQLDDRDRRRVGGAQAGLDDAGIAALALGVALGQHVE